MKEHVVRVLITGICGQDGPYLVDEVRKEWPHAIIFGFFRGQDEARLADMRALLPEVEWLRGDIADPASVSAAVIKSQPMLVFNLAAMSYVPLSWTAPQHYIEVNAKGVLNLLEAIRQHYPEAHMVQASTSEMFGNGNGRTALNELSPMAPASPYGVSKLAAHHLCLVYRESYGLHVSSAISFNHESPRRPIQFVTRKVTHAVARIVSGLQDTLEMGNLNAFRDWGYAGDFMEAYVKMAQAPEPDDYVVGTGETHSIVALLDAAFAAAGVAGGEWGRYVTSTPEHMRPRDVKHLRADPSKILSKLGWEPKVTFRELIKMMVEHDLEEVRNCLSVASSSIR